MTGYPHRPGVGRLTPEQRKALKALSDCELATGKTADELKAFHAAERARVLAKLEKAA